MLSSELQSELHDSGPDPRGSGPVKKSIGKGGSGRVGSGPVRPEAKI